MALQTYGLDFFYLDVDFFNNDKIFLVESELGSRATLLAVKLLCKIYHSSYYYKWGTDECLLFARKQMPDCTAEYVQSVVEALVKRGFFYQEYYEKYGILTSESIQLHYFEAVQRRKQMEVDPDYLLVDVKKYKNVHVRGEEMPQNEDEKNEEKSVNAANVDISGENVDILNENVDISSENVDIKKQSKGKESKQKEKESKYPPSSSPGGKVETLEGIFSSIPQDGLKRNCRGLVESLEQIGLEVEEIIRLVVYCKYGIIGHPVWKILAEIRNARGQVRQPVNFIWYRLRKT